MARVALVLLAAAAALSPLRSEATEIYRRATVLEQRGGRVEVRRAYGVRLSVLADCETVVTGCPEEHVYDEVVRLEFAAEHTEASGDEVVRTLDPKGTLHLALDFAEDDLETFRSELDGQLHRLSAQALAEPFAGWGPGKPPLDSVASRSVKPSWACFESGGAPQVVRFHRAVEKGPGGPVVVGTGSRTYQAAPTPVCQEMRAATEGTEADKIETAAVLIRLREVAIEHVESARLNTEDARAIAARPAGMRLFKRQVADKRTRAEGTGGYGKSTYAAYVSGGLHYEAYVEPADVPLEMLDRAAWLHRFTVETTEREFGPYARERSVEQVTLDAVYLATWPAAIVEPRPGEPAGVQIPSPPPTGRDSPPDRPPAIKIKAFVEGLVPLLDRSQGPLLPVLEEWILLPQAGLESEGWIAVSCGRDGSATYSLPPTKARASVTNAELFCAAVEARLSARR